MTGFTLGPALLFCPADRPDRYAKAAERSDGVILDLEDAVAPDAKDAARRSLVETPLDPAVTVVRVNAFDTGEFDRDLDALRQTRYRTVMLAKAEHAEHVAALAGFDVIALCETALGVINAVELASVGHVVALMWGAEDLLASLGGTSSRHPDGSYRDVASYARSSILLAAGSRGIAAIDSVYLDIADLEGLTAESEDAAASGFAAKACIHPGQVASVRGAFAPSVDEVAHAEALLAAAALRRAQGPGSGVFTFEGRMVDEPVLRHARAVLQRASATGATPRTY